MIWQRARRSFIKRWNDSVHHTIHWGHCSISSFRTKDRVRLMARQDFSTISVHIKIVLNNHILLHELYYTKSAIKVPHRCVVTMFSVRCCCPWTFFSKQTHAIFETISFLLANFGIFKCIINVRLFGHSRQPTRTLSQQFAQIVAKFVCWSFCASMAHQHKLHSIEEHTFSWLLMCVFWWSTYVLVHAVKMFTCRFVLIANVILQNDGKILN